MQVDDNSNQLSLDALQSHEMYIQLAESRAQAHSKMLEHESISAKLWLENQEQKTSSAEVTSNMQTALAQRDRAAASWAKAQARLSGPSEQGQELQTSLSINR